MHEYPNVSENADVFWSDIANAIDIGAETGGPETTFVSYAAAPLSSAHSTDFQESNGESVIPILDSNYQMISTFDMLNDLSPFRPPDLEYPPSHVPGGAGDSADWNFPFSFDITTTSIPDSVSAQLDELATAHDSCFPVMSHGSSHAIYNSTSPIYTESSPGQAGPNSSVMELVHRRSRRFLPQLEVKMTCRARRTFGPVRGNNNSGRAGKLKCEWCRARRQAVISFMFKAHE
jgi:hypothetical protein